MVELLEIGYIDMIDTPYFFFWKKEKKYRYNRYKKEINKFIKMKGLGEEYGDNNF